MHILIFAIGNNSSISLPVIVIFILFIVFVVFYNRKNLKRYHNPQPSKLKTDLTNEQPFLSPTVLGVTIQSSWWFGREYSKPFKIVFRLYKDGILAQVPGKSVQLAYEDIDYFETRALGAIYLHTKLKDPIIVAARVSKSDDIVKLLESKAITQK